MLRRGSQSRQAGQVPVAPADQSHSGGDEREAHERRVEHERDSETDEHLSAAVGSSDI
jgi:hypothetical protein